jgi:hypothetical protein
MPVRGSLAGVPCVTTRTAIAWVITLVWAVSYTTAVFTHNPVPPEITPVMLVVAGWLFGKDIKDATERRRQERNSQDAP